MADQISLSTSQTYLRCWTKVSMPYQYFSLLAMVLFIEVIVDERSWSLDSDWTLEVHRCDAKSAI